MSDRTRTCAIYLAECVYFRMYCDRVATGQMDLSEVPDRMAKALEEANKMLDRADADEFEAIQRFAELEHDYEAECRKALGMNDAAYANR